MRHVSRIGSLVFAMAVVATAIAAGCASAPPLRTEASTSGIRAAEEVGAPKVPRAALHLQLAKEELEHAKGLAAGGQRDEASSMLLRAEADAELAVTLSREDAEKSEARTAVERVRQLRQETN
jgi:type IV pilus biogenesis protein CpaD/CtpE